MQNQSLATEGYETWHPLTFTLTVADDVESKADH